MTWRHKYYCITERAAKLEVEDFEKRGIRARYVPISQRLPDAPAPMSYDNYEVQYWEEEAHTPTPTPQPTPTPTPTPEIFMISFDPAYYKKADLDFGMNYKVTIKNIHPWARWFDVVVSIRKGNEEHSFTAFEDIKLEKGEMWSAVCNVKFPSKGFWDVKMDLYGTGIYKVKKDYIGSTGWYKKIVDVGSTFKIFIDSIPTTAKLYIDNVYTKHKTPSDEKELRKLILQLIGGTHVIKCTKKVKKKYLEASKEVNITEGDNGKIILELKEPSL